VPAACAALLLSAAALTQYAIDAFVHAPARAANATVCCRAAPQSVRLSTERRRRALRSVRAISRPRSRSTRPDRRST
jgi:hypothetical protein